MRWPRPRFTLRWMMIAVAIVAVILGSTIQVIRLRRLSVQYHVKSVQADFWESTARLRAKMHGDMEKTHLENLRLAREELAKPMHRGPEWKEFLSGPDPLSMKYHELNSRDSATKAAAESRLADYWQARKERYLRASRYPWLPLAPDPPEPK